MKLKLLIAVAVVLILALVVVVRLDSGETSQATGGEVEAFDEMVGKPAPDFELPSYDGETYRLSELRGKNVVLFFNEGLMCYPSCWNQIAAFGNDPRFNNEDTVALNIVPDPKDGWGEAIEYMPELGNGTLLLDADKSVSTQYDTMNLPSSMHRGSMPGHTYMVIDKEGIVRFVYDDTQMGVQNDMLAEELDKLETGS